MQELSDKINNAGATAQGQLSAEEWNELPSEVESAITSAGQTLSGGDLTQLVKAIAQYSSDGDFYTDTGIANSYVMTKILSKEGVFDYTDGLRVRATATNSNTGASTLNVATLGVKDIKLINGGDLQANDILSGQIIECFFDLANDYFVLTKSANDVVYFNNVVDLLDFNTTTNGTFITRGRYTPNGKGAGVYSIMTLSEARTLKDDIAWLPDGYGDHEMDNFGATNLVAVLSKTNEGSVNFLAYGIYDDGTESGLAINAAFKSLEITGGTIVIPAGVYGKNATTTIYSNTIVSLSNAATIQSTAFHNPMFLNGVKGNVYTNYGANENISWEGGSITPRSSILAGSVNCFSIGQGKNISIRNVHFYDQQDFHFIEYNAVDGGWVEGCTFEDFIDGGGRDFSEAIQLDYMGYQGKFGSFGIGSFDKSICKNIFLTNNKFVNVGRAIGSHAWEGSAIAPLGCATGVEIDGVIVDGVLVDIVRPEAWTNFSVEGVQNLGTVGNNGFLIDDCDNFSISECSLGVVTGNGIIARNVLNSSMTNFSIDEITILGGTDGVDLKTAVNADIGKVRVLNVTGIGIRLTDCNRVGVQDSKIVSSGSNAIKAIDSNGISINKGNIQSSGASGIFFDQCTYSLVDGVIISSPASNCIVIDSTDNTLRSGVDVKNNVCIANGADGIQLGYCQDSSISGNTIRAAADGIKTVNSVDINVTGNNSSSHSGYGFRAITNSDRISFTANQARSASASGGLDMTNSGGDHFVNANDFKASGTLSIKDTSIGSNVVTGGNNV